MAARSLGGGSRSPSAFTTSRKPCRCLGAHLLRAEHLADGLGEAPGVHSSWMNSGTTCAAGEQVHQRGMLDADPHAADEEGGGGLTR